jgi:cytochrome b6-f complex iron-sulfur subunit
MKKIKPIKSREKAKPAVVNPIGRRDFFNQSWKGLGVLAAVEITGMFTAYLFSGKPKNSDHPKQLLEAGPATSFAPGSVSAFMGGRFYLARQLDGGFIALSLRCTHLGCSIAWEEKQNRFVCPCHSSAFSINGEVLNPPASRALDYYPVLIENGVVRVDIGTLKERTRFTKDQLQYV